VKVVGVVRSTTFLFITLCTCIQLFGVFPFQTGPVGLVVAHRDVAPAYTPSAPPLARRAAGCLPPSVSELPARLPRRSAFPRRARTLGYHGSPCPPRVATRCAYLLALPAMPRHRTALLPRSASGRAGTSHSSGCPSLKPSPSPFQRCAPLPTAPCSAAALHGRRLGAALPLAPRPSNSPRTTPSLRCSRPRRSFVCPGR
jgi:hypothetical protein